MDEKFEKLELNRENVYRMLKECRADNASTRVIKANFYSKSAREFGHKAPYLELDIDKLTKRHETIKYMVCQLHAVHNQKEFMTPAYGLLNYKRENWTSDNMALFTLFYLATSAHCMPRFEHNIQGGVACPIGDAKGLRPTFWPPVEEPQ